MRLTAASDAAHGSGMITSQLEPAPDYNKRDMKHARKIWDSLTPGEQNAMRGVVARTEFNTRAQFLCLIDAVNKLKGKTQAPHGL